MTEIVQRVKDWLRERRIDKLAKRLCAAQGEAERRAIYARFCDEINRRSPQQWQRMDRGVK